MEQYDNSPAFDEKPDTGRQDDDSSAEKGEVDVLVVQADAQHHFDVKDLDRVQRRLKQRHVQMIAIAGTMGTGLFLGSGHVLRGAGPLGALIAYALVGTVAYGTLCSLGEMASFAPISGSFPHYAARWVDPAFGFALGWNYFYTSAISAPVEITAAGILLTYWDANIKHQAGYITAITFCVCAINIFGVRWFGEAEFMFAMIKISLITLLILAGLIIDLGGGPDHERIGFRYWKNPGTLTGAGLEPKHPHLDKFLGVLSVIVQAAFSFGGMELIAVAASETENPRRNIGKAVRRVFWRILIFYILGIIITGMLVPYNDPALLADTGTAAQSPYVIAMQRAGISVLPSYINACIFTSAFSAANTSLFSASRILYGLALRGQAPKFLAHCTKKGLPLVSILVSGCFTWLSLMSISAGADTVFTWLVNLSTTGSFFSWGAMNVTYLRFYKGLHVQGFDRSKFAYWSRLQPFAAWWAIFWLSFFILVNGFEVFWGFTATAFFTDYVNIPIFLGLYAFWKIFKRTKAWKANQMDFVTAIPSLEETDVPEVLPATLLGKITAILF
ncbi:uncharacterized protein FIBRA_04762 [Fibroporia radiculosa]|uniref:Amino acid permease/ SLC12A domain-containing protein n=1 Tax=Fibroporia radiculosa TaxID=599839 RepID=J4G7X1_9APHY|nr:uncharacterized protein FIBRA_04762 [Fibroporia radiculosa]CCM02658.1 predicted protein [Fibroporia radiculosa]